MDPTGDWEQLELLCAWAEQVEYERIRPLVLFGEPVAARAVQTGISERTLYRRVVGPSRRMEMLGSQQESVSDELE